MIPSQTTVPSPKIEDRYYKKPLFCGPGPCDYSPSVIKALKKPCMSPLCDEYYHVIDDIRADIKYLFQTQTKLAFATSGAGHAGMEAMICNLVAPGETLVVACRGVWDERAIIIAKRHGIINVIEHRIPNTSTFALEELEATLRKHQPVALYITHGDSSTGTIQKLEGLGDICHKYNHTMSPPHMCALRACLKDICDETLPKVWERNLKVKEHFHKRLEEMGFEFFVPKPEDRFTNVTTVVLPKECHNDLFIKYILKKHNIYIFPSRGLTEGKEVIRIGNIGVNSSIEVADAIAEAMGDAINAYKNKQLPILYVKL